ncbi:MAG TPA: prephenate dehydratase domain-containing protein [Candidatus Paceibacterota bacterium]|nr:MAG: hypothetical protein A3B89_01805 [Candidatus Buchananbacteria bacterium RIFCSPHIGHO2_02_FULL_40_13]
MPLVLEHGGYGAIATETKAQGRVDPPVNSFIELLRGYDANCPLGALGATRMKLNFALIARPGVQISEITKIVAHPKALGACRGRIKALGVEVTEAQSNGKAAEDIAREQELIGAAAIASRIAAEKYGLTILSEAFEDEEAITTFFLLGPTPKHSPLVLGERNRGLFVFRTKHVAGALVKVLTPFSEEGINLFHIHSLYVGDGEYDFAIETECSERETEMHSRAVTKAREFVIRSILFGPFPVLGV